MAKSPKSSKKAAVAAVAPVPVDATPVASAPVPNSILKAKEFSAFQAALKRVANVNLKTATPEQKAALALDITKILQAIATAWPLIVQILQSLGLPVPNQPTPAPGK